MNLSKLTASVLAIGVVGSAWAQHTAPDHTMIRPDELKWIDSPNLPPGAKSTTVQGALNQAGPFIVRVRFPANFKVPPHRHTGIEHVTVLSGTFNMGVGENFDQSKTMALPAGGVAIMQTGTPHFNWVSEETVIQIHGVGPFGVIYVNPEDDPRRK